MPCKIFKRHLKKISGCIFWFVFLTYIEDFIAYLPLLSFIQNLLLLAYEK